MGSLSYVTPYGESFRKGIDQGFTVPTQPQAFSYIIFFYIYIYIFLFNEGVHAFPGEKQLLLYLVAVVILANTRDVSIGR